MTKCRNKALVKGVERFSRSAMYHKRGLWAIKAKNGGVFPKFDKTRKPEAPEENPPKFYPAEDAPKPIKNKKKNKPTKLRASITPGTVLIVLGGRFKGKRVVFLKQLESGLLLITGPFRLNGVPLRRVNQAYVIATSTKFDISSVDVSSVNDSFFKKAAKKHTKGEDGFFTDTEEKKSGLPQEKKELQKTVDAPLISLIEKVDDLKGYLAARFSLQAGMKPHELVF